MIRPKVTFPRSPSIPVTDSAIHEALMNVPRHRFVPKQYADLAYADTALPIGYSQTISQPYMVAVMTQLLCVNVHAKVLEVGTGSGYQAAILAQLAQHVFSTELIPELAARALRCLRGIDCRRVRVRHTDGSAGWPEQAPFDRIILTCAAPAVPEPLWAQLRPGGRMVAPIGEDLGTQRLVLLCKGIDSSRIEKDIMAVQFVPLIEQGLGQQP
jgi:protein-L-isoaspartate(D-aspartate) O-methyltransferase